MLFGPYSAEGWARCACANGREREDVFWSWVPFFFGPVHMFSGPRCVSPGPRVNEQCCRRKYVFVGPACEAFHILLDPCAFFLDLVYAHSFRTLRLGGGRPGVLRQRI